MSGRNAALATCLILAGCSTSAEPSRIDLLNLATNIPAVDIEVCRQDRDICEDFSLPAERSRQLSLEPGKYTLTLSKSSKRLSEVSYGIGSGHDYALAIYGLAAPPVRDTAMARAKRLLGGIDERVTDGFQLQTRMVMMTPRDPAKPAQVRLANVAPGLSQASGRIDMGTSQVSLPPVSYGAVSDTVDAPRPDGRMTVMLKGSPVPLWQQEATLPPGSIQVAWIYRLDGNQARVMIDRVEGKPG